MIQLGEKQGSQTEGGTRHQHLAADEPVKAGQPLPR